MWLETVSARFYTGKCWVVLFFAERVDWKQVEEKGMSPCA